MAANDPFGLTASGIPPELQAQYRGLTREQAIQEALLQQSQQPLGGVIDAGMFKVARSPWEGIAKIAQAYSARKGLDRTDERMGELGGRAAQMTADEVRRYQMAKSGAPGSSEQIVDETANGGEGAPATITAPAVAGNPRGAIDAFQMSRNPVIQALINRDETRLNRVEDLTMADRRARELQDNLLADRALGRDQQDVTKRDLAADADKRARDLAADADRRQREMQQFMVANRPPRQEVAPTVVEVVRDGKRVKIDARTNRVIGDAPPTAGMEKIAIAKKKVVQDLDTAISEMEKAVVNGGLIDKSTGSGAGAVVDAAAGFFGKATPGAIAVGQMKPIYDIVLKMVPRFEGPQSDKDTKTYQDASGQLANPAVPNEQKKAAGKEILRLMKARRGQFTSKDIVGTEADSGVPATVREVDW